MFTLHPKGEVKYFKDGVSLKWMLCNSAATVVLVVFIFNCPKNTSNMYLSKSLSGLYLLLSVDKSQK